MYLALKELIRRHGDDDLQFFQMCYYRAFNKHHDCVSDVAQYRIHAVIPKYVSKFVLEQEENESGFGF